MQKYTQRIKIKSLNVLFSKLPKYIKVDKRLTRTEKLIYAEVMEKSVECGFCYENDMYFSKKFDTNEILIKCSINQLMLRGYFYVAQEKDVTNVFVVRMIYINPNSENLTDWSKLPARF